MKKFFSRLAVICSMCCIGIYPLSFSVYAAENDVEEENVDDSATNGNYDYTQDEELTQSFYRPKTAFSSDVDYKRYCQNMYNHGYMDENYKWIPSAQNFINNMSAENMQILDDDAKQIVQERIDEGKMSYEDSPYLTYDEKEKMAAQQEQTANQQNTEGNGLEDDGSMIGNEENTDITEDPEESSDEAKNNVTEQDTDETENKEGKETSKTGKVFSYTIIILCITGIAAVAYSIYRKQF